MVVLLEATAMLAAFALTFSGTTGAERITPIAKLKKLYIDTPLVEEGQIRAVILHPPQPRYETAARELAETLRTRLGVALPVMPDHGPATWRQDKHHILALGHLGNSPLLRWLYFRGFISPYLGAGAAQARFRLSVHGADQVVLGREEDPQATYMFSRYGKVGPPLDDVPPVVHMVRAHKARPLAAGESFTMATCFWARSKQRDHQITSTALTPHAIRVTLDGKPMLAAVGRVSLDGLEIDAELSLIGGDRVALVGARRLALAGDVLMEVDRPISIEWALSDGQCHVEAKQAATLRLAGKTMSVARGRSTHRVPSGDAAQALRGERHTLVCRPAASRLPLATTTRATGRLNVVVRHAGASPVRSLWAGRLGSSGETVLVGHEDGALEALRGDQLRPAWICRCKKVVNDIDTGDLDGDGERAIAIGSDDHHLHALKGDGLEEPVGGASDMWYVASMWAIDAKGQEMPIGKKGEYGYFSSDGWCSGARVALAEDVLGAGTKSLFYGTRQGGVYGYPDPVTWDGRWYRRFGDQVDCLATLNHQGREKLIAVAGGDTNWVTAFDARGKRLWAVYLDAAVAAMAADAAKERLYVACDDGSIHAIDPAGGRRGSATLSERPTAMVAHPTAGIVVGAAGGAVCRVRSTETAGGK